MTFKPPIYIPYPAQRNQSDLTNITVNSFGTGYNIDGTMGLPSHSHGYPVIDPGHSNSYSSPDAYVPIKVTRKRIVGEFDIIITDEGDSVLAYGAHTVFCGLYESEHALNAGRFANFSPLPLEHQVVLPGKRVVFANVLQYVSEEGHRWSYAYEGTMAVFSFENYATAVYVALRFK